MKNPPTLMSMIHLLWQFTFALLVMLVVAFFCLILTFNQDGFQQEYDYTKMQWQTKVLPINDIITISFYDNQKFNYGLTQNEVSLSGYLGYRAEKIFNTEGIQNQVIYLDRADIPKPIIGGSYRADHVTLWVTDHKNRYGKPLFFVKEATIKELGDYTTPTPENRQKIGKRVITGTDFSKNKDIIAYNLRWNFIASRIVVVSILILLGIFGYLYRKKLSLFSKGLLALVVAEFLFYLYQSSIAYFNPLT